MSRYSGTELRKLRNEIPIADLIENVLHLPCKFVDDYFRFLCPICNEFLTATNPKTNLGRCFYCEKNFNPIDIVIIVKRYNFPEPVEYLRNLVRLNCTETEKKR